MVHVLSFYRSSILTCEAFPCDAIEIQAMEPHERKRASASDQPYRRRGLSGPVFGRVSINSLLAEPSSSSDVVPNFSGPRAPTQSVDPPNLHSNTMDYQPTETITPPSMTIHSPTQVQVTDQPRLVRASNNISSKSVQRTKCRAAQRYTGRALPSKALRRRHRPVVCTQTHLGPSLKTYSDRMDHWYRRDIFSGEVLLLARKYPLLRYAACALAAKQLCLMKNPMSGFLHRKPQERVAAQLLQGRSGVDVAWLVIKYHEKVKKMLIDSTPPYAHTSPTSNTNRPFPTLPSSGRGLMEQVIEGEDLTVKVLCSCILVQNEQISANRDTWSRHLNKLLEFLNLADNQRVLEQVSPTQRFQSESDITIAVKAGFWNFVVNDLEESR